MADNSKKVTFFIFNASRLKYESAKITEKRDSQEHKEMVELMYQAFVNLDIDAYKESLRL